MELEKRSYLWSRVAMVGIGSSSTHQTIAALDTICSELSLLPLPTCLYRRLLVPCSELQLCTVISGNLDVWDGPSSGARCTSAACGVCILVVRRGERKERERCAILEQGAKLEPGAKPSTRS